MRINSEEEFTVQCFSKWGKEKEPTQPYFSEKSRCCLPAGRQGFTLLELLIVIAITVLLSSFIILYGKNGRELSALYVEQAQIANVLAKAKELAVATYVSQTPSPACGYGVHFEYGSGNGTYQIYAYVTSTAVGSCGTLPNASRDDIETLNTSVGLQPANGTEQSVPGFGEYQLDSNLRFSDGVDQLRDVIFIPPEPHAVVWTGEQDAASRRPGIVYLETASGNTKATTTVNLAGQISF